MDVFVEVSEQELQEINEGGWCEEHPKTCGAAAAAVDRMVRFMAMDAPSQYRLCEIDLEYGVYTLGARIGLFAWCFPPLVYCRFSDTQLICCHYPLSYQKKKNIFYAVPKLSTVFVIIVAIGMALSDNRGCFQLGTHRAVSAFFCTMAYETLERRDRQRETDTCHDVCWSWNYALLVYLRSSAGYCCWVFAIPCS